MSTDRRRRGPAVTFEWITEKSTGVRYPFIPVFLERGEHRLPEVGMLLDTGADTSVLPLELTGLLGLHASDLRKTKTAGIGGAAAAWRATKAGIVGRIGIYDVQFPDVQFIANVVPILGRDALFGRFELRMNRDEIEIREIR